MDPGHTVYDSQLFVCWPEVVPILDVTADTMTCALLTGWTHFSCPQTITPDQGVSLNLSSSTA
jgi:hypothetical protein